MLYHYKGFVITMPFSTCEGLLCARHQAKQLTQVTALNVHSSPRKQVGFMILTFEKFQGDTCEPPDTAPGNQKIFSEKVYLWDKPQLLPQDQNVHHILHLARPRIQTWPPSWENRELPPQTLQGLPLRLLPSRPQHPRAPHLDG